MPFSTIQVEAVRAAFRLAGVHDELRTLPVENNHDRVFIINPQVEAGMGDERDLEVVLTQVLGLSVLVTGDVGAPTVAFP